PPSIIPMPPPISVRRSGPAAASAPMARRPPPSTAEAAVARFSARLETERTHRRGIDATVARTAPARDAQALRQHRILYIGGRTSLLPHLRSAAEARVAAILHHDGGVEDSLHRIEELIEGCDAVICPIDCISHGACRMAKTICRRLNKRFLPIPTASRSGFERALDLLASTDSGPHHDPEPLFQLFRQGIEDFRGAEPTIRCIARNASTAAALILPRSIGPACATLTTIRARLSLTASITMGSGPASGPISAQASSNPSRITARSSRLKPWSPMSWRARMTPPRCPQMFCGRFFHSLCQTGLQG
ncbi:MAG: DUF2325 domain-containing protein, partial [Hyphomicrobiaceae bacterium]